MDETPGETSTQVTQQAMLPLTSSECSPEKHSNIWQLEVPRETTFDTFVFERSGCSQTCVSDLDQEFFQHDAAPKIVCCATTSAQDFLNRKNERCRLQSSVLDVRFPIGASEFVFETVPWNCWYSENQVADICFLLYIILHLRAGRTFSEVVSTSSGASRGRFSTASFVQPPALIRSFLWEKRPSLSRVSLQRSSSVPPHSCAPPPQCRPSATSRHETPLLSSHGRDVPRGAVCRNCFHTDSVVIWP